MKNFIYIIIVLLGISCNSSHYYANYRAGGKMDREEKIAKADDVSDTAGAEILSVTKTHSSNLSEITVIDTLLIQNLPGNKKMAVIKEKKVTVENKIIPDEKNSSTKKIKKTVKTKSNLNEKSLPTISSSPFKDSGNTIINFIAAAIILGLIVFFISNSVGAGILTVLLFIVGGLIGAALAIGLVLWLIGQMIGEIINNSNRSFKKNKSIFNSFKSVDHGARIATFFWIMIGVAVLTGLLMALFMIPNFWVIALAVLGGVAAALLICALLAGFIDLIMPGDSMFSKNNPRKKKFFDLMKDIPIAIGIKSIFFKKIDSTKDIGSFFNIGLLVILAAFIVTALFFTLFDAVMVALLSFFALLAISAILCIGYAISYICFPGLY